MDLDKIPLMNALSRKLSWLSQRQEVISQNVANANTPGYRARDLEEPNFADLLNAADNPVKTALNQTMRKTSGKHISVVSTPSASPQENVVIDKDATDSSINGNTVVLEEQMLEMAKNQIEYSTMVNLYRRHMGLLKSALGNRSR